MEDFNCFEYSAEQKIEGRWLFLRILFIFFYVAFAAAYFVVIYTTRIFTLGALIPIAVWILVFLTWRYTRPDYKYEISAGVLRFYVIYKKKAAEKLKIKISSAEAIAPLSTLSEQIKSFKPRKTYSALPTKPSSDAYAILFKDERGNPCVFLFIATGDAIRLLGIHNKKTVKIQF